MACISYGPPTSVLRGTDDNSAMITEDAVAVEAPAVDFVHKNSNVFPFK